MSPTDRESSSPAPGSPLKHPPEPPTAANEEPQSGVLTDNDTTTPDEKHLGPQSIPKLRLIALSTGVSLGLFLSMLDSSIVATSLFTIAVEFGDVDAINWVALAYTLTYLSCAVLFARVCDVVGRRAAFAAAYVVFIVFSMACGFAQNMGQLIAFRAVQGLGGSGLYSVAMIILPEVTPDRAKKYIAAVVGCVLASAGVLGPVLGGILTQYTSWRWVFWINGPLGGVSLLVFLLAWPNKKYLPSLERRAWKDVDFVGAFLLIASATLIVFPFQNASESPAWSSAIFLAPLLTGLFALTSLFAWQSFLTRKGLQRLCVFRAVPDALNTMLTGFPYLLSIYAFPVRFQVVYGRSALQAGLMLLPMLAASAVGTVVAGAVNGGKKKQRFFETLLVACALMMIGCGLECTAGDGAVVEAKVLGFLVFVGLGFGLSAAGGTMLAGAEAPVFEHASAQGIVAQVRIFGGSIGIAASSAILGAKTRDGLAGGSVPPEMLARLESDPSALSEEQWASVRRVTMSTAAMTKRLEGKTILITGASSGIGRSCAFEFARTAPRNLKLVLTARRADRLREIAAQIRAEVGEGVQVLPVELDVADPAQVRGFVGGLPEDFRGIDVLVNNAGLVKGVARAPEIAADDINIMFQTNVTGLINMTQAVLPIFKARPDGGAGDIINIGSIAGREPYPGGSIYCATKAAVRSFTDSLRKELIDTRIRVMEVDPGQVETVATNLNSGCDPLTPDDIAEVVVFVAGRRQNVVIADTLIFPSHQAGAGTMHRKQT
ncbi:NADP-dependent 3-hydroxy acid dehydrogenase [Parachaetomium inaequale]|uniref:NADP-dependent 3-hydroxy acid dehydrogenase n=1 Tax=Parachaetomium inaequale TaxID=2588326 RepID=A0AAN6PL91_9PEZI|nr:NADP-dependent 3-hydroxy acid dehydrogenase [Parachaetomium inaequale]